MTHASFVPDDIDYLIVDEFPYPVAFTYQRLLNATNLAEKATFALHVFRFCIRFLSFTAVVQYLLEKPEKINDADLNNAIEQYMKTSPSMYWIELLELAIQAYNDHADEFFMPELRKLYWKEDGTPSEGGFAALLATIVGSENDIRDNKKNRDAISEQLQQQVRQMANYLDFFRRYELWYVREKYEHRLEAQIWRGSEPSVRHPRRRDIFRPDFDEIKTKQFYLCNPSAELLELHPLIINEETVAQHLDTGIYQAYYDQDTVRDEDDVLMYFMLSANQERKVSGDVVKLFLHLYKTRLEKKRDSLSGLQRLSAASLRIACAVFSANQSESIRGSTTLTSATKPSQIDYGKYNEQVYVERDNFNLILQHFLSAEEPALVIAGNAGVGKTNFLYHFYQQTLEESCRELCLWFDGARLATDVALSRTILAALSRSTSLGPIPTSDDDALLRLKQIVHDYLLSPGHLVIMVDGVNEHTHPMEAIGRINDFILELSNNDRVKVIITTRPQVWQHTRTHYLGMRYKPHKFFNRAPEEIGAGVHVEHDCFVLDRYRWTELEKAFANYTDYYHIVQPDLNRLNSSLKHAIREPLLLRFTCMACTEQIIPDNMQADNIIDYLIRSLVDNRDVNLYEEDFDFLREWIVPCFFPENRIPVSSLTRSMLKDVRYSDTRNLEELISDASAYTDGTQVNIHTQRLMETGWLVRLGSLSDYTLSFRYEYFYDYFVGKYLFEHYQASTDKTVFFRFYVQHLQKAPFLWGSLRNLLVDLLKDHQFALIEQLGKTDITLQHDLVVSVVIQHYSTYSTDLQPILKRWLRVEDERSLARHAAVSVACDCQIEDVIFEALCHRNPSVRALAIQRMPELWTKEQKIAERCLRRVVQRIHLYRLKRNLDFVESLLYSTLLIVMNDYIEKRWANYHTLETIQSVWRPLFNRLFVVTPFNKAFGDISGKIRRRILKFVISRALNMMYSFESASQAPFNVADIAQFFVTAEPERFAALKQLFPHVDAAADPNVEPLENIRPLLQNLIATDSNYTMALIGLLVLFTHISAEPQKTSLVIKELFDTLVQTYEECTDSDHPTAPIWMHILIFVLGNLPYRDMKAEEAEPILEIAYELVRVAETRYKAKAFFECGQKFGSSLIADIVVWGYFFNLPLGRQALEEFTSLAVQNKNHNQIKLYVRHLCEVINYFQQPDATFSALYDLLKHLEGYRKNLDENQHTAFWNYVAGELAQFGAVYYDHLTNFVAQFEDEEMPPSIQKKILTAHPREDFGGTFVWVALRFFMLVMKDPDPTIRNLVKWALYMALECKSFDQFLLELIIRLGNMAYGGPVFAQSSNI